MAKFLVSQFTSLPLSTTDLSGRTAIVTGTLDVVIDLTVGSNVGLGLEAARHLARMNPKKLVLACRNQEKGQRAVRYINETTGIGKDVVETWELDLASFGSVKAFAKRGILSEQFRRLTTVEAELDRLDILIENAGVATHHFRMTSNGWEETYSPHLWN